MKNALIKSSLTLIAVSLLASCASIIHGPMQAVDFTSQPVGATITIDGKEYGSTPRSIILRRKGRFKDEVKGKKEYAVKIELDGYYPYEIKLKREMDGWFIGNVIFGGLLGIIIDASNGAMYKLSPNQIVAQMGRSSAMNINQQDDKIYVAVTLDVDPSWQRIGTLEKIK